MTAQNLVTTGLAALAIAGAASAQTAEFEQIPMGLTVLDMSPDGRFFVGDADQDGNGFPDGYYIYDALINFTDILPGLPTGLSAVSDDGSVMLGTIYDPIEEKEVAAIFSWPGPWQSLGHLPNALSCPSHSTGYELSADGTVAVGLSWDGCSGRGFVWREETGMQELDVQFDGGNRATCLSADGTVVGGFGQGSFSRSPVVWNTETLAGMPLDPPDGDATGEMMGIADDGNTLYGIYESDACTWSESNGVQILGSGSIATNWVGYAMDVADDQGTIVGFDALLGNRRAWIYPPGATELLPLNTWVMDHGGPNPGALGVATRISRDGTVIAGHSFFQYAWIVRITWPECPADLDGDLAVGFQDLLAVLAAWGTDGSGAELAEPTNTVDFSDLVALLADWGPCID